MTGEGERMASVLHGSPRPLPVLLTDTPFSQRKRTPFRAGRPPKAPAKSCPPVSRVFHTPRDYGGPKLVSFKSERKQDFSSPYYDSRSHRSYFEQCFEVLEKMGEGSFGEVFKARSREDGRLYAVKKSRQRFRGQWDRRQKLAEVEKHERLLAHPNCVKFYRAWEEREFLYIQTELCEMSLSEYADLHGQLPERRVWGVLIDLLKGLSHLHNNNLCHFDIKPENIFLSLDRITCKLGDFGLCVSEEQGFKNAMEGDAKYLAPELMQGRFGKPADVFSLGISVLELACELELPSGGSKWHLLRQGKLPREFIQGLSPALISILTCMMDPCPEARPTVNQLLQESCIRWAGFRHRADRLCGRVVMTLRTIFSGFVYLLMTLVSLFTFGKLRNADISPKSSSSNELSSINPVRPNHTVSSSGFNDSFSDDENDLLRHITAHQRSPDESSDTKSRFNHSWINNSPMRYPSPVYTGPPIPLNFGDSSFESSPERSTKSERATKASPPRINLNQSYYSSSPNTSSRLSRELSSTPLYKSPPSTSSPLDLSRNIEPKNLLSVFDTSD